MKEPEALAPSVAAALQRVVTDRARGRRGLAADLSRRLGRSRSTTGYWLEGTHPFPLDALPAIAELLETTPEGLLADARERAARPTPLVGPVPNVGAEATDDGRLPRALPVYRSGAPMRRATADYQAPPAAKDRVLQPDGFGVLIVAGTMAGAPLPGGTVGYHAGDVCWVAPGLLPATEAGDVVAARVRRPVSPDAPDGPFAEMVLVRILGGAPDAPRLYRHRAGDAQPSEISPGEVVVLGPVVAVSRTLL